MKQLAAAGKRRSMKAMADHRKPGRARVGELPVVILPLEEYERMREDLEMLSSKSLPRQIEKARQEAQGGKTMTLAEVKRKLRLT